MFSNTTTPTTTITNQHFPSTWEAYVLKVEKLKKEVQRRSKLKFDLKDRMPPQCLILELAAECLALTKQQHGGEGNVSYFYTAFRDMCDIAETSFYNYSALPKKYSHDNFITLVDVNTKDMFQKKYMAEILTPYLNQGGRWKVGRSAIDNTFLPNVMLKKEFDIDLVVWHLKRMVTKFLRKKQEKILQTVFQSHDKNISLETAEPETVKSMLSVVASNNENQDEINTQNLSFKLLRVYGSVLENAGQLPQEVKEFLWKTTSDRFAKSSTDDSGVFERFVKFSKEKPGEYFDEKLGNDNFDTLSPKQKHLLVQTAGLWIKKLKLKSRHKVEDQMPIRYITHLWKRKFPLTNVMNKEEKIIRVANSEESSRIRANQGSYMPLHGMSMGSSGYLEGLENTKTLFYSWGVPRDPKASISNWHCDIEKMAREVVLLNPKGIALPGESYFTVGQNSVSGSSINVTQHTQISGGILKDFKIYTFSSLPQWCEKINAELDLIQVGEKADAFYLKIITNDPASDSLLVCLNGLKMSLLHKFGGCEKIDFHVHMIPNGNGKFTIIFAPLTHLEVSENDVYVNPDSGETHVGQGSPVKHIHLGHGSGTFGIDFTDEKTVLFVTEAGKNLLGKLYDFTAKPGSRDHVIDFLNKNIGFKPKLGGKSVLKGSVANIFEGYK